MEALAAGPEDSGPFPFHPAPHLPRPHLLRPRALPSSSPPPPDTVPGLPSCPAENHLTCGYTKSQVPFRLFEFPGPENVLRLKQPGGRDAWGKVWEKGAGLPSSSPSSSPSSQVSTCSPTQVMPEACPFGFLWNLHYYIGVIHYIIGPGQLIPPAPLLPRGGGGALRD